MCGTRHNIGADVLRVVFQLTKKVTKFHNFICLIRPNLMNISGKNVKTIYDEYNCTKLIVLHDELDLPMVTIKISNAGTNGHNGLKSIKLYFHEFIRIRIGIGRPDKIEVSEFVLEKFAENELKLIPWSNIKENLFNIIEK